MRFIKHTILLLITTLTLVLLSASSVRAAVSVRLSEPKSPTYRNDIRLTFVALDTNSQTITVTCYKKGPTDGGFSQFDSAKVLLPGGNSDTCVTDGSFVNQNGTYQFKVAASAGSDSADSNTVSVDYNASGPEAPGDYSKDHISSCQYKISFKTANDGKTVKVEIYRSENTSFTADSGTRVGEVALGPNTTGSFTDSVPDCSKTYYYVIRSFDSSGNGSSLVGDQGVTTSTTTTTQVGGGAIPVRQSGVRQGGQVLGDTSQSQNGQVLGDETSSESANITTPTPSPSTDSTSSPQASPINSFVWIGLIAIAAFLLFLLVRPKRSR